MLVDLIHILIALIVQSLFCLGPGYVLARTTNLLGFRSQSITRQLAIGMALSLGIVPIALHLVARLLGLSAAAWMVTPIGLLFVAWIIPQIRSIPRRTYIVGAIWIAIATFATIDLKIGSCLYGPATWYDYTKHTAITAAIERTGVPPTSPYFHPGEPVQLFYYYLWFLMSAASDRLSGGWIGPASSVIGGMIWTGAALMGVIALLVDRLLASSVRIGAATLGLALLMVTGVDILPSLITDALTGQRSFSVEKWNDQTSSLLSTMIWVPHHVGAVVACFAGVLLMRSIAGNILEASPRRHRAIVIVGAGACFASAAGMSVYVTATFAVFVALHALVQLWRRKWSQLGIACGAGAVALLFALPLIVELHRSNHSPHAIVALHVRDFWPALHLMNWFGVASPLNRQLVCALCLPLYWGAELGFFALASIVYWRSRRRSGGALTDDERFFLMFAGVSLLVSTFCKSIVHDNDLGWRSSVPAQLLLLVWSIAPAREVVRRLSDTDASFWRFPRLRRFAVILLVLGMSSTAYDMFLLRTVDVQRGSESAQRSRAAQQAFQWIDANLPDNAIVQANPDVPIEFFGGLYGHRQVVAVGEYYGTMYGVPIEAYRPVHDAITPLFTRADYSATTNICRRYTIDAMVFSASDPIWKNQGSWIWRQTPLYKNEHFRVMASPAGMMAASSVD